MADLRPLDALGEEFARLGPPPGRRISSAQRTLLLAAVVGLLLAGVAAAAILISSGSPLPAPHVQDLKASGVPLPSTVRLAGLDARDPEASALPWDIRLSRTRAGEICSAVGQVLDGQFGIVGLDGVFRAQPLGGVDACGVDSPTGPILAGARVFVGSDPQQVRTVVNGIAGEGTRSVTAYGPGGPRLLHLGPQGSFITVFRGYVEDVRPRIVVVSSDGSSHDVAFAQSSAFEVADPAGGSPWQAGGEADLQPGAAPDEDCAQVSQEQGPSDPSLLATPTTPEVCGQLAHQPLFVLMRRFVPGSGEHSGWPWGNNPARTIVYGVATPRVASLTLTGAGTARALAIDPHGGVFMAVLDGHVDPRSLKLSARLRDGQSLTYTHSTGLLEYGHNRALPEAAVPAYSDPLPAARRTNPPLQHPLRTTVRETLRTADPGGGPLWALRTWQGVPTQGPGAQPKRLSCVQLGVLQGNQLVEPRPGTSAAPIAIEQESGIGGARCNGPEALRRMTYMLQMQSYIGFPYTYSPRPVRTVLYGMLPAGAADPVLLGVGGRRRLPLDANNAFLVVLPGSYWDASPHITYRLDGRLVGGGRSATFPLGPSPSKPQARTPDPDGGAPWGFAVGPSCATAIGRIVEGRLADIDEASATLTSGAEISGSGGTCSDRLGSTADRLGRTTDRLGRTGDRLARTGQRSPFSGPVSFDLQQAGIQASLLSSSTTISITRPQLERRTLPGRTIITGFARPDVVSVTLATPRDVRTLRPVGPHHALIVVYDGEFFRGALTATITLRNGLTVTEAIPGGPAQLGSGPSLSLSPGARLRAGEERLSQLRSKRPSLLVGYLAELRRRVRFERSHPGLLPAS